MVAKDKKKPVTVLEKTAMYSRIEKIVDRDGCTFIEAVARYAEDNNITQNKIAKMICPRLREEIEMEAKCNRLVRNI